MGGKVHELKISEIKAKAGELKAGDRVILSGTIYTSRDAAHKRLFEILDAGGELPFDIEGAVIYYAGPTPGKDGRPVGACGPTTSSRMDGFAPRLLDLGLGAMIGKGERNEAVEQAIIRNGAVYFCAVGGAGALVAKHIVSAEEIAFADLGCESVKRIEIEEMPLTVAIDCSGGNIFRDERAKYKR